LNYIQTFESYLKGGRAPLYHFIINGSSAFKSIIKDDTLKRGQHGIDKNLRKKGQSGYIPSISVTRNRNYTDRGSIRLELDNDLLFEDKYQSEPFDEMGVAISRRGKFGNKYSKHMNPFYGFKTIKHGKSISIKKREGGRDFDMEEEFEERFYEDIVNLGKYIMSIKFGGFEGMDYRGYVTKSLKKYIEKYPHIKILNREDKVVFDITHIKQNKIDSEKYNRTEDITI
jgi:hypothetical protein